MRKIAFILILLNSLFNSGPLLSQDRAALEKAKIKLSKDIALTNSLLAEAKKKGNLKLEEVALLKKKISLRQKMIRNVSFEMQKLGSEISRNEKAVKELEGELEELKADYANLIQLSYKTRNTQSWLMYVFASDDFAQATRRIRYLKEISNLRERQAERIEHAKEEITLKTEILKVNKKEKATLLALQEGEKKKLNQEKKEAELKLGAIKKDEKSLRKRLKEKEQKRQKLAREIKRLIELEMKPKTDNPVFTLTPEEKLISGNFSKNKGHLPWPVERGVVTGKFGTYPHPELPGIVITNNGIDISTDKEALVRALFKGKVAGVINIPGAGQAVMLKHGDYWTVYSNLSKVFVSKGEVVETKESLGLLLTDGANSKSHIEIWRNSSSGMTKLDPQLWIAK
ncbi:MAG: peptidoglycan DD-metalloendopeptidase family protein [Bacteroidota bacterium]